VRFFYEIFYERLLRDLRDIFCEIDSVIFCDIFCEIDSVIFCDIFCEIDSDFPAIFLQSY